MENPIRKKVRKRVYQKFKKLAKLKGLSYLEVLDEEDRTYKEALEEEIQKEVERLRKVAVESGISPKIIGSEGEIDKEKLQKIYQIMLERRRIAKRKREEKSLAFGLDDTSGHKEGCRCPKCNPEFEPISDEDVRRMESEERLEQIHKVRDQINENIRERFDSSFCPRCGCNPCICREGGE